MKPERKKLTPFPQELRYKWVPVLPGQTIEGWILCKPWGLDSHYADKKKQTLPCRHALTKGLLKCFWGENCHPREIAYWALWVPTARKRLVVTLSRTPALIAEEFSVGSPVRLFRPKTNNNPPIEVTLLSGTDDPSLATTQRMRKRGEEDIFPYLLHLWQDQELSRVCGFEFRPSRRTLNHPE